MGDFFQEPTRVFTPHAVKVEPPAIDPPSTDSGVSQVYVDVGDSANAQAIAQEVITREAVDTQQQDAITALQGNVAARISGMHLAGGAGSTPSVIASYDKTTDGGGKFSFNPNSLSSIFTGAIYQAVLLYVSGTDVFTGTYSVAWKTMTPTLVEGCLFDSTGTPLAGANITVTLLGKN